MDIDDNQNLLTQSRRWCFTINNPFGTGVDEIDIEKTDLELKSDYYDISFIEDCENSGLFNFKYVKITQTVDDFQSKDYVVKRPFFKDSISIQTYLENLESFKYSIFSIERGLECETEHVQGFIIFKCGKRFRTLKNVLPFAHLEKAKGSSTQCREYCLKSETHIDGPFESGKFAEERERTDIKEFIECIKAGYSKQELSRLNPTLYLKERNKIDTIYSDVYEDYSERCRDVIVTYVYGLPGVGKTSYVRRLLGLKDTFFVDCYDNAMFTNYKFQNNLVLDEFSGQLNPQHLNRMLDVGPYEMRGLGRLVYAAFHNVYIISNYSPREIYKDVQISSPRLYQAINRRFHRVIRIDNEGIHIERDTIWEDCTNDKDKELGLTKQVKCTYEIDKYGNKITLYSRHNNSEMYEVDIPTPL